MGYDISFQECHAVTHYAPVWYTSIYIQLYISLQANELMGYI